MMVAFMKLYLSSKCSTAHTFPKRQRHGELILKKALVFALTVCFLNISIVLFLYNVTALKTVICQYLKYIGNLSCSDVAFPLLLFMLIMLVSQYLFIFSHNTKQLLNTGDKINM